MTGDSRNLTLKIKIAILIYTRKEAIWMAWDGQELYGVILP